MRVLFYEGKNFSHLQKYKIKHMYLFGSQARGTARADIPHLLKVQLTEHCKNNVPLCVPATAPRKGATHGTLQK